MDTKHLKMKDRIRNEYFRVKNLLGRRPSRIELFTYMDDEVYQLAITHSKDNPFRRYLEYLKGLDELLREADIVSVHTPLTSSTKHMIADRELAAMKPGSYLINTARGPVVDAQALCRALNDGTIAGAAIDVFDQEPPLDPEDPLLQAPNLIVTPHIGFYTEESMDQRAKIVFDNLSQWLQGNWVNQVKP